ncbi:uncharacterized protein LOC124930467 [Impatiens glandulifera]|uniref:uncharacterized protein LOC124930467 n=1 Tax=Impatiens glandulifera TaxID=253017 RepID=UPI001FB16C6E|nr:uncharacterized protein LOC124930467 [Impatiens glandulifera]
MVFLPSFSLSTFLLLSLTFLSTLTTTSAGSPPQLRSSRLIDLLIRDYTFKHNIKKTGKPFAVHLPTNLSGIHVTATRLRCGSLRRYGLKIGEFRLDAGVSSFPCAERIIIVRQNLGNEWSSIYYENFELSGYKFISPVLGLLAYNYGLNNDSTFEVGIQAGDDPILIDFSNLTTAKYDDGGGDEGLIPLCASFRRDGRVTVARQGNSNICVARENGHFGLVVEIPLIPARKKKGEGWWQVAIGVSIVTMMGVFLMAVVMVVFISKMKRKMKEEIERIAYEEEALQVTMAGHIRAPTAPRQ